MTKRVSLLFSILTLLLLAQCSRDAAWPALLSAVEAAYPDVERISTDSLASWMHDDQPPVLLDTRTIEEYEVSHLESAVHVDPDSDDFMMLDTLDRDAPIVAYCSVGYRSSDVASKLMAAGFTDVRNLEGSIFKWANEGRPVYRDGERVHEVHPYNAVWGRLLKPELHSK